MLREFYVCILKVSNAGVHDNVEKQLLFIFRGQKVRTSKFLCDLLQKTDHSIFYKNAVEACKVSRVENGVREQIFFPFKILIFIPLAIYGPNFIT